ncbi:uncharacterized protein [Lolium perenne]|uniref:uncharacterized protein n=1 Tax=Lolium perenne TaxID=4522 RepID=UPI0021F5C4EF|nr:pumilio domain-containing protein C6G9.14-like [Lolium perenne]
MYRRAAAEEGDLDDGDGALRDLPLLVPPPPPGPPPPPPPYLRWEDATTARPALRTAAPPTAKTPLSRVDPGAAGNPRPSAAWLPFQSYGAANHSDPTEQGQAARPSAATSTAAADKPGAFDHDFRAYTFHDMRPAASDFYTTSASDRGPVVGSHAPRSSNNTGAAANSAHPAASDLGAQFNMTMPRGRQDMPRGEQMYGAPPNAWTPVAVEPAYPFFSAFLHGTDRMMRPEQRAPTSGYYPAAPLSNDRTSFSNHPSGSGAGSMAASSSQYPHAHYGSTHTVSDPGFHADSMYGTGRCGAAPASSTSWPSTYHGAAADSPRSTSDLDVILSAMHGHGVVHLLDKGDQQIRSRVLAAVNKDVHLVMVHPLGCDVFQALLRCCAGHYEKLWSIVQALATTNYHTWRCKPSDDRTWIECMKRLVTAVAPYQHLYVTLLGFLTRKDLSVVKRREGDKLLALCFCMIPYQQIKPLILHVLANIEDTIQSCDCLRVCFDNASIEELVEFQKVLLTLCTAMAKGKYGNYFVQHVLRNGTTEFKQPIVQRLMHDVVALSTDNHGSHVVQLCFKDLDVQLLCNVLTAFRELTERQLAEMVRGRSSKYVLHKLLDTHLPQLASELAQRLATLPGDIWHHAEANVVKRSANRVLGA